MELLQEEYTCLYFLVSKIIGNDTSQFMDFCRDFCGDDEQLYVYYVHGWIIPRLDSQRDQNNLNKVEKLLTLDG